MATAYKVLAQAAPSATSNTDIYTVPASTETIISTLVVANRGTAAASYRIAIRPDAAVLSNIHYIAYDVAIPANDSINLTLGLTINASDVVTVYASSANFTFSIFGSEITPD
jgi:hypothetical protein